MSASETLKQETISQLSSVPLLGNVITWDAGGAHPYAAVKSALRLAGLDEKACRDRLPRNAFARACRELAEERVIDVLDEDPDQILFQFSKRYLATDVDDGGEEFRFFKETKISLDKQSGKLTCKDDTIRQVAQDELDKHMQLWTTGDITAIVQRLFEREADLIPIRSRGGAYFVFAKHNDFVRKVDDFLRRLGGKVNPWPVPAGTKDGDACVQDSLTIYLRGLVTELREAVKGFSLHTRENTIADAAEKITTTRVKIQAYASYLREEAAGLLAEVDTANTDLLKQIDDLNALRKTTPPEELGKDRFGFRLGSNSARINACLNGAPKTVDAITAETGLTPVQVKNHLHLLRRERGVVKQLSDGSWVACNGNATPEDNATETAETSEEVPF